MSFGRVRLCSYRNTRDTLAFSISQSIQIGRRILLNMDEISEDGLWRLVNGEWVPRELNQTSTNSANNIEHSHLDLPVIMLCPACNKLLHHPERNNSGEVECSHCSFLFNYPTLTNQQQLIAGLGKIELRLHGISNAIWLVFFLIPLIVSVTWLLILI